MYQVFDNDMPADSGSFIKLKGSREWKNSRFITFKEALEYAKKWLGNQHLLPPNWNGQKYDYSGYGDTLEIKEI